MIEEHVVIVGNGPAANAAADVLREQSPEARVTVIGREPFGYYKPHLLPDFIAGKVTEEDMCVRPPASYKERGIKLRLGQKVVGIDFGSREITLDHKEVVKYSGLILTCGGTPELPDRLHAFQDTMLKLKTLSDAKVWKERLQDVETVLILGGDLTSLSFAKAVLSLGKHVKFFLNAESFWPLRFTEDLREQVAARLRSKGIDVLDCRKLNNIRQASPTDFEVETDTGKFSTDIVGAFCGLVPDVGFLSGSGLHIERGILVDQHLRTNFPGVFAAGDCAQVYHPELKDYWVSIGYENAVKLGRIAARNLAGDKQQADIPPEDVFSIEGIKVSTSWWTEL